MPDRGEPNDRLQREIDEILSNIEQFPDAPQRKRRAQRRAFDDALTRASARQREWVRSLGRVSLSQLMLLSGLMILGAFFFRALVPIAWPWVMYAGVILFVVSFGLVTLGRGRNPISSAPRQYWRGREVEYRRPTLSQRLRRWWGSRRR